MRPLTESGQVVPVERARGRKRLEHRDRAPKLRVDAVRQRAGELEAGIERLVLLLPDQETTGYWAVVRYDDVRSVSRDPATFRSGEGVMFEDADPTLLEASMSFLATDAPRHTKLRGLVNAAFTPRQVRRITVNSSTT